MGEVQRDETVEIRGNMGEMAGRVNFTASGAYSMFAVGACGGSHGGCGLMNEGRMKGNP
jgi:hypothetical protein